MSLVPILYTALLIFVLFSVIIVVVSYVSYKVRQRSLREDEHSDGEYYNNYYSQPTIEENENRSYSQNTSNSIKVVSTIKRPDERKTVELPYYHDYQQTAPTRSSKYYTAVNDKSYQGAQHYSRSRYSHTGYENETNHEYEENQVKNYQDIPRTRTNPGRSRIQILNKLQPTDDKRENTTRERYHSSGSGHIALPKYFAGFQAISYYSEEEEEAFFKASQYTKE